MVRLDDLKGLCQPKLSSLSLCMSIFYYSRFKLGIYIHLQEKENSFLFSFSDVALTPCRLHILTYSCWLVLPETLRLRAQGATVLELQGCSVSMELAINFCLMVIAQLCSQPRRNTQ